MRTPTSGIFDGFNQSADHLRERHQSEARGRVASRRQAFEHSVRKCAPFYPQSPHRLVKNAIEGFGRAPQYFFISLLPTYVAANGSWQGLPTS